MKIEGIELKKLSIRLKKPFKTALRTVNSAEEIIIIIKADDGSVGYGEAPPTAVITGDTSGAIIGAIKENIENALIGEEIGNLERIMYKLDKAIVRNTSARAAVDMAIYDLFGKLYKAPVYKLLGGYRDQIETDITISVNDPNEMMDDALGFIKQGFTALKMKVGIDSKKDIERVKAVRQAVGYDVKLRLDANQGWQPKEAVRIVRKMEDMGLDIELIEQPVKAWNIDGLKFVTDNTQTPIMADESMFSSYDAFKILGMRAADLINIKLMKCGGIYNALKIIAIAETCGVECMVGSMIESKLSATAAAHLACAKKNIIRFDLDTALLLAEDPIVGGIVNEAPILKISNKPGLGIERIDGLKDLNINF
ncbi:dipeptide epimerase [Paramaledivibacter caminithermalis]|jgi:o-succinylbenzoate synthase|uniref:Dipeptide epimerase n=1 Tax=Paramaledivibacter caminithermalis (strain DSM 15212 / CIP 107654 / DViRD3) TaxID=1121301 RepID=A0A1M6PV17_PARC5|nr:dipeptide epimerase [Paramaledivibacter caminithermalis]SHK11805.1 o-succinylbenzoate synthase [Paramaledivibacter caminithermalis DSM 15212]